MLAVRARALLDGRLAPSIDDVLALAEPVLKHRMALTFAARADGETIERRDRQAQGAHRITEWPTPSTRDTEAEAARTRDRRERARSSAAMPRLILEARRVAATVIHGLHGRRRAGTGENFWQFRRFVSGEPAAPRRLAPLGARRPSLCARAGMGSRAHGLDLAGPLALDGVRLAAGAGDQARPRAGRSRSRSPKCWSKAASASAFPGLMRPTASRDVIERMAEAIMHDADRAREPAAGVRARRRCPRSWCSPTCGARSRTCAARIAQLSAQRRARPSGADRRSGRGDLPLFRPRRVHRSRRRGTRSRPAAPRPGATTIRSARRAPPRRDPRRDRPARLELHHPPHRPAGERAAARAACAAWAPAHDAGVQPLAGAARSAGARA